jgi:archaellum component FlaG (FlaF/FlaG flagellin family)
MKKLVFIAIASFMCLNVSAQTDKTKEKTEKKSEKPAVTFKTTTIDRPSIAYGADETFTFEFKNTGKTPIIISNVATSCGCTTADKPSEPVAPGKSSKISVKYDTKRVGAFTKTITVTTNVGDPIVLTIKGTVNPETQNQ